VPQLIIVVLAFGCIALCYLLARVVVSFKHGQWQSKAAGLGAIAAMFFTIIVQQDINLAHGVVLRPNIMMALMGLDFAGSATAFFTVLIRSHWS